jgi:hypothetical protein
LFGRNRSFEVDLFVAHGEAGILEDTIGRPVVRRRVRAKLPGPESLGEVGELRDDAAGVAVAAEIGFDEEVDDLEAVAAGRVELGAANDGVALAEGQAIAANLLDYARKGGCRPSIRVGSLRRHVNATPCNYIMLDWQLAVN